MYTVTLIESTVTLLPQEKKSVGLSPIISAAVHLSIPGHLTWLYEHKTFLIAIVGNFLECRSQQILHRNINLTFLACRNSFRLSAVNPYFVSIICIFGRFTAVSKHEILPTERRQMEVRDNIIKGRSKVYTSDSSSRVQRFVDARVSTSETD